MTISRRFLVVASLLIVGCGLAPRAAIADVTGFAGGNQPFSTVQPSLAMNYLISLQGIFPSDNGIPNQQFLGEVTPFAGNFAPSGWALANGQLLPINQNQALFALLGTTYGGNGINTFALPDLRGRAVIGTGQGPGLANRTLGETVGTSDVTMTIANLPAHDHNLPGGGVTGTTGGSQPMNNMQPSLAMNYYINEVGIYPSRDGGGVTQPPFIGQVGIYAGSFPASFNGAPYANGQIQSIAQNTAVFSILETNYGGNGVNTFALPDLRGRAPISSGQGPGLSNRVLGEEVGQESTTLTEAQLPPHVHTLPGGGTTAIEGSGLPIDNMRPVNTLNYIIATDGVSPSPGNGGVEPFIGEVSLFAGNFAPSGWAFANGQILSIAQNTALFSILTTTYGGNGQTTFGLPDLRGRVLIGSGQGPGLPNYDVGEFIGGEDFQLSTIQMAAHNHTLPVPEPGSILLAILGAGLLMLSWRRRSANSDGF